MQNKEIQEHFKAHYNFVLEKYKSLQIEEVLTHYGELSDEKVNDIGIELEVRMLASGVKKGIVKRMFSVIVEALQNIRLHGERDTDNKQCTYTIIGKNQLAYYFACGNLILNDNILKVENKIIHLNELTKEQVKEHYMQVLTDGMISQKGGAGLGFITITMKSRNKLNYEFIPANEKLSVFAFESHVDMLEKE